MYSRFKNRSGFSLVEIIIIVGIIALLSVGAVAGFQGIQGNARRSAAYAEASALASALNSFNAIALDPISAGAAQVGITPLQLEGWIDTATSTFDNDRIELVAPPRGVRGQENFVVHFQGVSGVGDGTPVARRDQIIGLLDVQNDYFRVNADRVREIP